MAGCDGNADDRQRRPCRRRAGEVRRHAGAGDDHLDPAVARPARPFRHQLRRPVRRQHLDLGLDAHLGEDVGALLHHRQVRLAADNDPDFDQMLLLRPGYPAGASSRSAMSLRKKTPSKVTRATLAYARSRAAATVFPDATMVTTRPPRVM